MRLCCESLRAIRAVAGPSRLSAVRQAVRRPAAAAPIRHQSSRPDRISSSSLTPASRPSIFDLTKNQGSQAIKPFYITTPIFYVNASPHVGHLHSLVLSDVIARYAHLRHPDRRVIFSTGTDEHGLKIQQAAKAQGIEEQAFCDIVSQRFRDLADQANTSHTTFIRTSEPRHHTAVEAFWAKLVESGNIYKGTHAGWYSVSDECFYSASQVTEGEGGKMVAIESGSEVVWEEETNWKFRLSGWKAQLREWASQPGAITPEQYQREVLAQLDTLEDLSVSRPASRVKWGVPVPGDSDQTIYVWVDALVNYATVVGYPGEMDGWPADVHVVGKDIIRFHAIHWPALLMAAQLPPPRQVLAHAHWTMDKAKMSKSRGNVVDPVATMNDVYGVDGVRWYLMRVGGDLRTDADYGPDELVAQYRALSDTIGNLVGRISSPAILGKVDKWDTARDTHEGMQTALQGMKEAFKSRMDEVDVSRACEGIMDIVQQANRLMTETTPWKPTTPSSTQPVIYAYQALLHAGVLLQPIMPGKAGELLDRLGIPATDRSLDGLEWDPASVQVEGIKQRLEKNRGGPLFAPIKKPPGAGRAKK